MQKKTLYVFSGILAVIALVIIGWNFFAQKSSVSGSLSGVSNVIREDAATGIYDVSTVKPSENKIGLETRTKDVVPMDNFFRSSQSIDSAGDLALTPAPDFYNTPDYDIAFYPKGAVFRVSINKEPVEANRRAAEKRLLEILGVSQDQACKLNVYVGISKDIDESYAGVNVGLTFCK